MVNATRTFMKNGRRAMIGHCGCCGTKMSVAGKWDSDNDQIMDNNAQATSHSNNTPIPLP